MFDARERYVIKCALEAYALECQTRGEFYLPDGSPIKPDYIDNLAVELLEFLEECPRHCELFL